jgi:hypothetical protein
VRSEARLAVSDWRTSEAWNAARFRDRNEWIRKASIGFGAEHLTAFICECGDLTCEQPIELTGSEYESARSRAVRFVIALYHENPESEAVVRETARFAFIDKVEGIALRVARSTDPRAGPPPDSAPA